MTEGVSDPEVAAVEERVEALRDDLTGLVDELDHRRHELARKLAKPAAIAAAALGVAGVAYLIWRGVRRRPTRRFVKA